MRPSCLTTLAFAPFLAAASCQTPALTDPCDVLVVIPDAPPDVNRILVERARPTALGLARNKGRVARYGCVK